MTTKPGKRPKSDRVLMVRDLNISFQTANGKVNAIRGVRMDLYRGETIAIVGESGSGKSVTVKTLLGILAPNGTIERGRIDYTFTNDNGER
ncbi:MAG: ATP-binding cassette domain-containing protein, partial [Solobacterium sp.]|nr:ATP-binding cassette domain-containing protein [Solobacterium sp.]